MERDPMYEYDLQDLIKGTEKSLIINILKSCRWDKTQTAKKLNISRTTLWRKMKKYELTREL